MPHPTKRTLKCVARQYSLLPGMLPKLGQVVTIITAACSAGEERTMQQLIAQCRHGSWREQSVSHLGPSVLSCRKEFMTITKMLGIMVSLPFHFTHRACSFQCSLSRGQKLKYNVYMFGNLGCYSHKMQTLDADLS